MQKHLKKQNFQPICKDFPAPFVNKPPIFNWNVYVSQAQFKIFEQEFEKIFMSKRVFMNVLIKNCLSKNWISSIHIQPSMERAYSAVPVVPS